MIATDLIRHVVLLLALCVAALLPGLAIAQVAPVPGVPEGPCSPEAEANRKQTERRLFQAQELITARPGTWIFKPGETPRIVWRDVEEVRRLGGDARLRVRWFDAKLERVSRAERARPLARLDRGDRTQRDAAPPRR